MATFLYVGFVLASFLSAVHCSCNSTQCEYNCCIDEYGEGWICCSSGELFVRWIMTIIGMFIGAILLSICLCICCDRCWGPSLDAQGTTRETMNAGIANPGVEGDSCVDAMNDDSSSSCPPAQDVVNAGAPWTYPAYGQQQPMTMGATQAVGGYNAPQPMGANPVTQPIGGDNTPQAMSGYNSPQPIETAPEPRDEDKWQQAPPEYSTLRYNAPKPIATASEPRDDDKWQQAPPAYSTLRYNAPQPIAAASEPRDDEKWQQAPPAYSTLNYM